MHLKVFVASLLVFFALDLTWLGVVAKGFYNAQLGHLTRPDVQWPAALLFYLIGSSGNRVGEFEGYS